MHTERYCDTLDKLDPVAAVRAIHRAWLQLSATDAYAREAGYDNGPAIRDLAACLKAAGHPGFTPA